MKQIFRKLASRLSLFFSQFYSVPYYVPTWGWDEHWAILNCLITGRVIDGPHKERLYLAFRNKTGKKYVFGFNSGSDAIYAALKTRNIGRGDKVILPSYCCESVARAIVKTGATPVFCDMNEEYNPEVESISMLIDPCVKAIVFPHLFGNPAAIDKLEDILSKDGCRTRILLIDDAAQSFGARLNGKLVGTFGDAGIISFGPGKTMIASGGGLLLTNSDEIAAAIQHLTIVESRVLSKLKRLMYYLIFRRWRRFTLPLFFLFWRLFRESADERKNPESLCNVDAAVALAQLSRLEIMLKIRLERKNQLDTLLSTNFAALVAIQPENTDTNEQLNVASKYVFRWKSGSDLDLQERYRQLTSKKGIELFDLYSPLHKNIRYGSLQPILPLTEQYSTRILQIPIEPSINKHAFDYIKRGIPEIIQDMLVEIP
jgi:dTDP-4-amino-4,6-dideoxygalactose transaminase